MVRKMINFFMLTYSIVPLFANSLTIGAMSLERYFLICQPALARHSWFFSQRKLLYSVLSVLTFGFPVGLVLFQALCSVIVFKQLCQRAKSSSSNTIFLTHKHKHKQTHTRNSFYNGGLFPWGLFSVGVYFLSEVNWGFFQWWCISSG